MRGLACLVIAALAPACPAYAQENAPEPDYLRRGLARASGGNSAKLFVIYCQADCWMSWNAAKRVLSYGYPNVAWYPEGTDGWQRANLPACRLPS
jgi:PQQ-dependent catabolism-associated CXXCW motif protein